ncbi:MAG: NgoFVII family restriction endonuclease [Candidatus Woesearchaeota archaeon]
MLAKDLPKEEKEYYGKMLKAIGALSRLFSESDIPYLEYRLAENLFCKSFNAENVSRSDASVDAVFKKIGIGIKTFQGNSPQKIAEFNKDLKLYNDLENKDKILKISELRNERLKATERIYSLKSMIYHCIKRKQGKIIIHEYPMELINISKIKNVERKRANTISFEDDKNSYYFNLSKSVLMRKFGDENPVFEIDIKIMDNPFKIIEEMVFEIAEEFKKAKTHPFVILPLYSTRNAEEVPERSGLNQWNAEGRPRDKNEVYIPIPSWIHSKFSGFFPKRDTPFKLRLPNGDIMDAKVCQDNSKALMSKRNKDLGKWILREVLQLKEGELLTYDKLQTIGIDSVIVEKISDSHFEIDFRELGSFEEFKEENKD